MLVNRGCIAVIPISVTLPEGVIPLVVLVTMTVLITKSVLFPMVIVEKAKVVKLKKPSNIKDV